MRLRGRNLIIVIFVATLAFATYAPSLSFQLLWDDPIILKAIRAEVHEGGVVRLATMRFPLGAIAGGSAGYYRPLTLASFFADSQLLGGSPFVFHLTNVLLHTLASVLLCRFLWLALGSSMSGLAGGLLFAVHPVHTEAVAFVSGRTDLLACVFVLSSAICWLRERRSPFRPPWAMRALSGVLLLLGVLSKETAIMLPPVLLAWDALESREQPSLSWWERNRSWLGTWTLALILAALARFSAAGVGIPSPASGGLTDGLLAVSLLVMKKLIMYLRLLAIPWPLNAYYTSEQIAVDWVAVCGAGLLLGGSALLASRQHGRTGLLALCWMVGFLVPLFGVTARSGSAVIAERYLYLPSIGLSLLVGAAVKPLAARAGIIVWSVGSALLAAMAALALARSSVWRDSPTFFGQLTRESPGSWVAWINLGDTLAAAGRHPEAVQAYHAAAARDPLQAKIYYNLGSLLAKTGNHRQAIAEYQRALQLDPGFADAAFNMGNSYLMLGMVKESRAAFSLATALERDSARGGKGERGGAGSGSP